VWERIDGWGGRTAGWEKTSQREEGEEIQLRRRVTANRIYKIEHMRGHNLLLSKTRAAILKERVLVTSASWRISDSGREVMVLWVGRLCVVGDSPTGLYQAGATFAITQAENGVLRGQGRAIEGPRL